MALKDWKKKRLDKTMWSFTNINNRRRIYLAKECRGTKWYVEMAWMNHDFELFDTKLQALRFAKAYMRSH